MKSSSVVIKLSVLFFLISIYSWSNTNLNREIKVLNNKTDHRHGLWDLNHYILNSICLEFKGLVADYLILEAGARLGTKVIRTEEGGYKSIKTKKFWDVTYKIFSASQALDPTFAQTYMLAQGWLPWEPARMLDETLEILEVANKNRPWDWRPLHLKGFDFFYFEQDPIKAGKVYMEAALKSNAPPYLPIVGSRLIQKGGETKEAIKYLTLVLNQTNRNEPSYNQIFKRLLALKNTLLIEGAINQFQNEKGFAPSSIENLVAEGYIKKDIMNPYGAKYCIKENGTVTFDELRCK